MGAFAERYKTAKAAPERGGDSSVDFEGLPILSEALAGVRGTASGSWEVPPQSLTIWVEGPWVKFCLGCEQSDIKTFGSFQELSQGLDGVEISLRDGKCDTKPVKRRNLR